MQPYILKRVVEDNKIVETSPVNRRRVLQLEVSEIVSRMLSEVVDNTLAGGTITMPEYHIAAKTGTAQIPNEDTSGYSNRYLHTFFGYAPAFNPEFLILLFLEKPQGVRYASQTLSEPFRELTEFIINYYEIPPDR
jgi:cell division protein FtsI/penicillin-binding protein 2